jgi:mono/diheme cytochrome c family protein
MKLTLVIVAIAMATAAGLTSKDTAAGKKLYTEKCGRCHKFYKIERYPEPAWNMWMGQMIPKTKLTPEQADLLTRYLQSLRASHTENDGNGAAHR